MADTGTPIAETAAPAAAAAPGGRTKDEIALDLMKFIAVTTGYGKATGSGTGFSGKGGARSSEEYTEALLGLFERCRKVVSGAGAEE